MLTINTFSTLIFNQYRTSKMFVSVVYTSFCYSTRIELRNTGTLLTKLCVFISCVLIGFEVQDYLYFSVNTKVKLDIGFGLYGLTVCKAFIKRLWLFFFSIFDITCTCLYIKTIWLMYCLYMLKINSMYTCTLYRDKFYLWYEYLMIHVHVHLYFTFSHFILVEKQMVDIYI